MSRLSDQFINEQDDYNRELAYLQQEVEEYENWLWMEQQQLYDQKQKETKIKVVFGKEKEQLKEE